MKRSRKKFPIGKIILYSILGIYAVITFYPFVWAIAASFKPIAEITAGGLQLMPEEFTTEAYQQLLTDGGMFIRWVINSFFIGIIATVMNVAFNTMAGYALARIKFKGRDYVASVIIASITIPAQVLLIPNYLIITRLGLNDTYTAVILLSAINAGYIIMMRQFFVNLPKDVEEAARIDGLGRWGIFWQVAFPMAKPAIATQALFIFMGIWNEFLKAKLYLSSPEHYTVTVGLQALQQGQGDSVPWNLVMASSVMSIIPILILYIVLNKYFMSGMRIGGDK